MTSPNVKVGSMIKNYPRTLTYMVAYTALIVTILLFHGPLR